MKSSLENALFIKKEVYKEYKKTSKLFFLFVNFFFFPSILIIEGLIVFKLVITLDTYHLEESLLFYIFSIWIFALFIVATSSMMISIKKVYSQKIIENIIKRFALKNTENISQYIEQIRPIVGEDLKIMLSSDDFLEWSNIKLNSDHISIYKKFILIEKSLELYPSKDCPIDDYISKASYKYKQIDKFYT